MPRIRQAASAAKELKNSKAVNWFPGHMYSGMQAMMGKLNTVDCVVEVHDARIPFTGRNRELKEQLGTVKPHLLVLNKRDLADLSKWKTIEQRLKEQGDKNIILTDLTGSQFSQTDRGYPNLMNKVVDSIYRSDRYNRQDINLFKIMIVGIPNVGKSTLINRLRQHHLGIKGEPAKTGSYAGVTRHVENVIKICSRPPIYSMDTPGILQPGSLKDRHQAMRLALCSTINDAVLNVEQLAQYLLDYLNESENGLYLTHFGLEKPVKSIDQLVREIAMQEDLGVDNPRPFNEVRANQISWRFIKNFRKGYYGKVMFE